jgi:hypothetical protein
MTYYITLALGVNAVLYLRYRIDDSDDIKIIPILSFRNLIKGKSRSRKAGQ